MPIRGDVTMRGRFQSPSRGSTASGPPSSETPFRSRPTAERLRQLAGTGAEVLKALDATATTHHVDARHGLERADQHGRRIALRLGDEVQQAVDPVGEVHVCVGRRAEQHLVARRAAIEGVAGRVLGVVALGLDDHSGRRAVNHHAADQVARDPMDRAVEEVRAQALAAPAAGLAGPRAAAPLEQPFLLLAATARGMPAASVNAASTSVRIARSEREATIGCARPSTCT